MGRVADRYAHEQLPREATVQLFETAERTLADRTDPDARAAMGAIAEVMNDAQLDARLPEPQTANALRTLIASDVTPELVGEAQAILGPADNYGGKLSFRWVVPLCGILTLIFGALYARDRATGGYRVERIGVGA
jgi:hypothetical protein